jgi:chemotaxis protein CheC
VKLASTTALEQDALREVANIGAGHAASMLARLVGGVGVMLDVPRVLPGGAVSMTTLLGGEGTHVVAVKLSIQGGLRGQMWWVLPREDAARLGGRLLRRPALHGKLSNDEHSALAEAANVVASACLDAIGKMSRVPLLPSTPQVFEGDVAEMMATEENTSPPLVLESRFHSTDAPTFGGQLVLTFDGLSVAVLMEKLGLRG